MSRGAVLPPLSAPACGALLLGFAFEMPPPRLAEVVPMLTSPSRSVFLLFLFATPPREELLAAADGLLFEPMMQCCKGRVGEWCSSAIDCAFVRCASRTQLKLARLPFSFYSSLICCTGDERMQLHLEKVEQLCRERRGCLCVCDFFVRRAKHESIKLYEYSLTKLSEAQRPGKGSVNPAKSVHGRRVSCQAANNNTSLLS